MILETHKVNRKNPFFLTVLLVDKVGRCVGLLIRFAYSKWPDFFEIVCSQLCLSSHELNVIHRKLEESFMISFLCVAICLYSLYGRYIPYFLLRRKY